MFQLIIEGFKKKRASFHVGVSKTMYGNWINGNSVLFCSICGALVEEEMTNLHVSFTYSGILLTCNQEVGKSKKS